MQSLFFDTTANNLAIGWQQDDEPADTVVIQNMCNQASELVPQLESMLERHRQSYTQLDYGVTLKGPGSFTGIRIGLTVAKMLKLVAKVPIVPLTTFELLVWGRAIKYPALVVMGAGVQRLFWTTLTRELTADLTIAQVSEVLDFPKVIQQHPQHTLLATTEVVEQYPQLWQGLAPGVMSYPEADAGLALGRAKVQQYGLDYYQQLELEPLYIREPDINKAQKIHITQQLGD